MDIVHGPFRVDHKDASLVLIRVAYLNEDGVDDIDVHMEASYVVGVIGSFVDVVERPVDAKGSYHSVITK